jgi:hypothetical protein
MSWRLNGIRCASCEDGVRREGNARRWHLGGVSRDQREDAPYRDGDSNSCPPFDDPEFMVNPINMYAVTVARSDDKLRIDDELRTDDELSIEEELRIGD